MVYIQEECKDPPYQEKTIYKKKIIMNSNDHWNYCKLQFHLNTLELVDLNNETLIIIHSVIQITSYILNMENRHVILFYIQNLNNLTMSNYSSVKSKLMHLQKLYPSVLLHKQKYILNLLKVSKMHLMKRQVKSHQ